MYLQPKERTIVELEHSLQYEIQSKRHISIVELLATIPANIKIDDSTNGGTNTTVDGGHVKSSSVYGYFTIRNGRNASNWHDAVTVWQGCILNNVNLGFIIG